jgi:ABC-type glycerol-3-phosphate transport system substrate-binding protein
MIAMKKVVRPVSCLLLAGMLLMGCAKGDTQNAGDRASLETSQEASKDYVYLPKYQQITDEVNSHLNSYSLTGDSLYYIETLNVESKSVQLVCQPLTTDTDIKKIPLDFLADSFINFMMIDNDGNIRIFVQSFLQENEDPIHQVITIDQMGQQLSALDVSAQINADPDNAYLQYMAMDEAGRLYLSGSQSVWLYDQAGEYYGTIDTPGTILNMGTGKDGKVYIVYTGYPSQWLAEIDYDLGSLGVAYDDFPSNSGGILTAGEDSDFLLNEADSLVEYDLSAKKGTKILDWADSNISSQFFRQVCKLTDGRIAAINLILGDDRTVTELVILTKTPVSELPAKEEIVVASIKHTSVLKQQVSDFNSKSDKYKVVLKTYLTESDKPTKENIAAAVDRMNLEIASNHAPDMVVIPSDAVDWENYVDKNILADLNPFFASSETLQKEDLVDSVVRAFTYDDKLFGMPSEFIISTLMGRTSVVGDKIGWTLEDFNAFMDEHPNSTMLPNILKEYFLSQCVSFNMDHFIDWEQGISQFDGEDFKELLELIGKIPELTVPGKDTDGYMFIDNGDEKPVVIAYYVYGLSYYLLGSARAHEPVTYIGYPTIDGNGGNGIRAANGVYSILDQSKHKEGAWAFFVSIFDTAYKGVTEIPVKKSELDRLLAQAAEPYYMYDPNGVGYLIGADGEPVQSFKVQFNLPGEGSVDIYAMTQEEIDGFKALIDSAKRQISGTDDIMAIIQEEAKGYFEGQKSLDEVADIIQNRVQIYVSENR